MRRILGIVTGVFSVAYMISGFAQLFGENQRLMGFNMILVSACLLEIIFVLRTFAKADKVEYDSKEILDRPHQKENSSGFSFWILFIGFLNTVLYLIVIVSVILSILVFSGKGIADLSVRDWAILGAIVLFTVSLTYNIMTLVYHFRMKRS